MAAVATPITNGNGNDGLQRQPSTPSRRSIISSMKRTNRSGAPVEDGKSEKSNGKDSLHSGNGRQDAHNSEAFHPSPPLPDAPISNTDAILRQARQSAQSAQSAQSPPVADDFEQTAPKRRGSSVKRFIGGGDRRGSAGPDAADASDVSSGQNNGFLSPRMAYVFLWFMCSAG